MVKRDFLFGAILTTLVQMTIQDYYGLELYIARLRENWMDVGFPIMATVTALAWLFYFTISRKVERLVIKPGMKEVLALNEGDVVIIQRRK